MTISETIRKALIDAVMEPPSHANLRLPYLQACLSDSNVEKFVCLYKLMGDNASKLLFLKLLYNSIGQLLAGNIEKFHNFLPKEWHKFEVLASDIKLIAPTYELDIIETLILSGYAYKDKCQVDTGDIVLDCGAYTGNTAFYFADKAGPDGRIFSFEAMPQNFASLQKNITSSGYRNITAHQFAIADVCGNACFTRSASPGSCRVAEGNGIAVDARKCHSFDSWIGIKCRKRYIVVEVLVNLLAIFVYVQISIIRYTIYRNKSILFLVAITFC